MVDLERAISVARKSGDTELGMKKALRAAKVGSAKAIIVAGNAPSDAKEDLLHYSSISKVPIIHYNKSSQELGNVIGRPHLTAFIVINSPGDSDILSVIDQ